MLGVADQSQLCYAHNNKHKYRMMKVHGNPMMTNLKMNFIILTVQYILKKDSRQASASL